MPQERSAVAPVTTPEDAQLLDRTIAVLRAAGALSDDLREKLNELRARIAG